MAILAVDLRYDSSVIRPTPPPGALGLSIPDWTCRTFLRLSVVVSDDWNHLGEMARARRKELGLTQEDIKKRGGPSPALVRQIENGRYDAEMQPSVRRSYERALEWTAGSLDRLLVWGEASPLTDRDETPPETDDPLEKVNRVQVEFERAITHFVQAEAEMNSAMREFARSELIADGTLPTAVEIATYVAWSAAHDARDWTRYEMALIEYVFESGNDPRNGSLFADINEQRERVRRLGPRRISEESVRGGDGDAEDRADRSSASNTAAAELSAADDQLGVAAKKGAIEESGEFNT